MHIAGLQKLTLLDYPGKTAATVFAPGCNFRCPFCHNADLVTGSRADGVDVEEFFAFLEKRRGLLDGVCVTGGEPLLQPQLADFCERIKRMGFAVKLDTNGSLPDRLRTIVEAGLTDYVAMDVKNAPDRYAQTAGVKDLNLDAVHESVDFLLSGAVPFEFRTTVVRELHTANDLLAIARWIAKAPAWHLQNYLDTESVLTGPGHFHAWRPDELRALLPRLQAVAPAAQLRGMA